MRVLKKIWFLVVFSGNFFYTTAQAQQVTVSGSWSLTIDEINLQSGAGSNLVDTYESNADQISIQLRLRVIAVQVPPTTYTTAVTYIVTEI